MDSKRLTKAFVKIMFDQLHDDDGISGEVYDAHREFLEMLSDSGETIFGYINTYVDAVDNDFYIKEMTAGEKAEFFDGINNILYSGG